MDLDAPSNYASVDRSDALADVEGTAGQWSEAAALGPGRMDLHAFSAVVICGMGGSGIGGDVLWALSLESYPRPIVVHKGYGLPGFVDEHCLVVAFSHSGATEETLTGFAEAGRRGAARLVVSSGGPLVEQASAAGVDIALLPRQSRPPRHSLGYLLVPALVALGLDDGLDEAIAVIKALTTELGRDVPLADNPAKQLGGRLADRAVALSWGGHGIGSVAAYRFKCQMNENAKAPAMHGELPEAGHNDVVGWEQPSSLSAAGGLVTFRDPAGEHPRVAQRFDITENLLQDRVGWSARIEARGTSALARVASLLVQADLVSVYTALAADVDPTPIASIDRLKSELGAAESLTWPR